MSTVIYSCGCGQFEESSTEREQISEERELFPKVYENRSRESTDSEVMWHFMITAHADP